MKSPNYTKTELLILHNLIRQGFTLPRIRKIFTHRSYDSLKRIRYEKNLPKFKRA